VALLIAMTIAAVLAVPWVIKVIDGGDTDAQTRVERAVKWLRETPAVRYRGALRIGAGDAQLDLVVSNPGDAKGVVKTEGGHAVDYLGIDGQSFIQLDAQGWTSVIGLEPEKSRHFAGKPVTGTGAAFPNLASILSPTALVDALSLDKERGHQATVGKPVDINGRPSTPILTKSMTVYLGEDESGAQVIDRVVISGYPFDLTPLTRDQVAQFYAGFRSSVQALREAIDLRIVITPQSLSDDGNCPVTSCTARYRVSVTFLGEMSNPTPVRFTYQFAMDRDGQPSSLGPACSGTLSMNINESRDLTCTGVNSATTGGRVQGEYHTSLSTSEAIFDEGELTRLLRVETDHREAVVALADRLPR
jgi:hypothetical protein